MLGALKSKESEYGKLKEKGSVLRGLMRKLEGDVNVNPFSLIVNQVLTG